MSPISLVYMLQWFPELFAVDTLYTGTYSIILWHHVLATCDAPSRIASALSSKPASPQCVVLAFAAHSQQRQAAPNDDCALEAAARVQSRVCIHHCLDS